MVGKFTFLKAISISVYLSHIGFLVPAEFMKISLFKGLLTIIKDGVKNERIGMYILKKEKVIETNTNEIS